MDYKRIYDELISSAIINNGRPIGMEKKGRDAFLDRHHIIPKCIGGSDNRSNLVYLTPRQHLLAHHLLIKIYDSSGLRFAYHLMSKGRLRRGVKLSQDTKDKISQSKLGKPRSEEAKEKMRKPRKKTLNKLKSVDKVSVQ
ncbi:homing endonuclease [Pectobacterium phage Arno162]|uniref:Homing endonuclease n=1 Tax=Pectobacterium phage Arno162 TaxID=2500577 RepID=A0A678ZZC6_9CAUD|nr:homing endonuclease [Pectobacterium phage Arno162]